MHKIELYRKRLEDGFSLIVLTPDQNERDLVHRVIFDELCMGVITEESRKSYREIIRQLILGGAECIILGCTEIVTLVTAQDSSVPIFDTTAIHARRAVELAILGESAW